MVAAERSARREKGVDGARLDDLPALEFRAPAFAQPLSAHDDVLPFPLPHFLTLPRLLSATHLHLHTSGAYT